MVKEKYLRQFPKELLSSSEEILIVYKPWLGGFLIKPIILFIIGLLSLSIGIGVILILISLIWMVVNYLKWRATLYAITNKRIIVKKGIIGINYEDARIDKIQNIFLSQGIIGRLLNYGDIGFSTAGVMGLPIIEFKSCKSPKLVLKNANEIIARLKEK